MTALHPIPKDKTTLAAAAAERLMTIARACALCPWQCGVDRTAGQRGRCKAGPKPKIFTYGPHRGEEPPLVGTTGSGTVFFSHCSLACVYCQNYRFSQDGVGTELSSTRLAELFLELQTLGCANLNLVTAAHFAPWIWQALTEAFMAGLTLPIVYNTSGYERLEIIELLHQVLDVYLVDMRYSTDGTAAELSGARDYRAINRSCVRQMLEAKGPFRVEGDRPVGVIIRILVLPGYLDEARDLLRYIARSFGTEVPLSIMGQYQPFPRLADMPFLNRRLTYTEYERIIEVAVSLGLDKGWRQEPITDASISEYFGEGFPQRVINDHTAVKEPSR